MDINKKSISISYEVISNIKGVQTIAVMCEGRLAGIFAGTPSNDKEV